MATTTPPPADEESRRRLAQRTAAILISVAGAVSLLVVPIAAVADLRDFHAVGIVVPALMALAAAPVIALAPLSWRLLHLTMVVASGLISVGVATAGSKYPLGAVLYLWSVMIAFLFFGRVNAILFTALVAVEYAMVVSLGDGFGAPLGWWLYLMVTAVVTGAVVDWMVRRTQSLAEGERSVRLALEEAHVELATLNRTLEERVDRQVGELASLGELRRFLSPQVAETLLDQGHVELLEPHRREIAVFFCDLRGFTAFTSEVEPEEVLSVLAEYYDCVGALLREFDATIGPLSGDGVMAYFNDPVSCDDPSRRAVDLAVAVQGAVATLVEGWAQRGHDLGCGVGIASGYATLGLIGFEGKRDYGPMGSVVNRASRLCDEAIAGQILVDAAIQRQLGETVPVDLVEHMTLKGFPRPVPVYELRR